MASANAHKISQFWINPLNHANLVRRRPLYGMERSARPALPIVLLWQPANHAFTVFRE